MKKNYSTGCLLWIIAITLIIFLSCTPAKNIENRFAYVKILKIEIVNNGYWVYFKDQKNSYKTFQHEKPDTIQPGNIVKTSRIFRVNKY